MKRLRAWEKYKKTMIKQALEAGQRIWYLLDIEDAENLRFNKNKINLKLQGLSDLQKRHLQAWTYQTLWCIRVLGLQCHTLLCF